MVTTEKCILQSPVAWKTFWPTVYFNAHLRDTWESLMIIYTGRKHVNLFQIHVKHQVASPNELFIALWQRKAFLTLASRAATKHIAADGRKFHLLNLFSNDEMKGVSLLVGYFIHLTGLFHNMLLPRSMSSLEPGVISHQGRKCWGSP